MNYSKTCEAEEENKKIELTRIKQKPVIKNSEIKVEALYRSASECLQTTP